VRGKGLKRQPFRLGSSVGEPVSLGITVQAAAPEFQYQNPVERTVETVGRGFATMFCVRGRNPDLCRQCLSPFIQPVVVVKSQQERRVFRFLPH
jgi:hypothetical protein